MYCTQSKINGKMAEGRVKWFNKGMGYGFIESDKGNDVFVHYSSIAGEGFKSLRQGERVSFTEEDGAKGPQATQVKPIQGGLGKMPARERKASTFFQD
jgi:cold shock protein